MSEEREKESTQINSPESPIVLAKMIKGKERLLNGVDEYLSLSILLLGSGAVLNSMSRGDFKISLVLISGMGILATAHTLWVRRLESQIRQLKKK